MADPPAVATSTTRVVVLLGTLVGLTVTGSSAVAVALPQAAADLRLDTAGSAWVLAAFGLTFSVSTALFGRLGDLYGLRMPLRVGIVILTAGSLLATAAWNFPVLVAARLLQGAGSGAVPVLTLAVIAHRFPGPARARVMGGIIGVVAIVSGSGPLLGGGIAELLSWRWVLAVPALTLLLGEPVARLAPGTQRQAGRPDVVGVLAVTLAVTGIALLLQAPSTRPAAALLGLMVALVLGGAALGWWGIRRRPDGFLPVAVVGNPTVMRAAAVGAACMATYIGMLLALPLLLDARHDWRPLSIGLALLPAALSGAVFSRLAGPAAARLGRRRLVLILTAGSAAGALFASRVPDVPVLLVAGMVLVVAAFAGGQVVLLDAVSDAVPEAARGAAFGVFNLIFFMGGAVGAAGTGGLAHMLGLPAAMAALALLPALAVVLAVTTRFGKGKVRRDTGETGPPIPT